MTEVNINKLKNALINASIAEKKVCIALNQLSDAISSKNNDSIIYAENIYYDTEHDASKIYDDLVNIVANVAISIINDFDDSLHARILAYGIIYEYTGLTPNLKIGLSREATKLVGFRCEDEPDDKIGDLDFHAKKIEPIYHFAKRGYDRTGKVGNMIFIARQLNNFI